MNHDKNYADLLQMMRTQGAKDNPTTLQLGVMQGANSVKIDDLLLYAEDLYIAADLLSGFKKGDLVAVMKLNDNDKYVILAKVVRV